MKKMSAEEIQIAYMAVRKRAKRHLMAGVTSGILAVLLAWPVKESFPVWLICINVILLALTVKSLFQLWLDFRCPCCGAFLGSRRRVFHHDGWKPGFPKSCWQCHTDFDTGKELPHDQLRWRNMPVELRESNPPNGNNR